MVFCSTTLCSSVMAFSRAPSFSPFIATIFFLIASIVLAAMLAKRWSLKRLILFLVGLDAGFYFQDLVENRTNEEAIDNLMYADDATCSGIRDMSIDKQRESNHRSLARPRHLENCAPTDWDCQPALQSKSLTDLRTLDRGSALSWSASVRSTHGAVSLRPPACMHSAILALGQAFSAFSVPSAPPPTCYPQCQLCVERTQSLFDRKLQQLRKSVRRAAVRYKCR